MASESRVITRSFTVEIKVEGKPYRLDVTAKAEVGGQKCRFSSPHGEIHGDMPMGAQRKIMKSLDPHETAKPDTDNANQILRRLLEGRLQTSGYSFKIEN